MKSSEELAEICIEIYRQMYKEAEPSADFDELISNVETNKKDGYMNYYLDIDRQNEIIQEICERHEIYGKDRRRIDFTVHFGCSPNSYYEGRNEIKDK